MGVTDIADLLPAGEAATRTRTHWFRTRIGDLDNADDRKRIRATSPCISPKKLPRPCSWPTVATIRACASRTAWTWSAPLKKAGKPFELIIEDKEGHGFRKEELSIAHYTRVDAFLKKHVPPPGGAVDIGPAKIVK